MSYSLYDLIWIFIIYAFVGWCLEIVITTIQDGKYTNRGFLIGPFCPIYGFGVVGVLAILSPVRHNLLLFFLGSMLLATILELFVGYMLEKFFSQKWWDYKDEPFNFKGYICLWASVSWGLACTFMAYVLQPLVNNFIHWMPIKIGIILILIIGLVILVDLIITLFALYKIKKKIFILNEIGKKIELLSYAIGQNISDGTVNVMKINEKNLQEIEKLKQKYHIVLTDKTIGYKRILKAYPHLKPEKNQKASNKSRILHKK